MSPTPKNGKICYLELPASDVAQSSAFYATVFGWSMRRRGDGTQAFDDTTGEVSGAFVTNRKPVDKVGSLIYVMVDDAVATCAAIVANGGRITVPLDPNNREIVAQFADPGGNILGIYQEPRQK